MAFYKILPETTAYERAYDAMHHQEAWVAPDFMNEFEERIGISPMSNLAINRQRLCLKEVPEDMIKYFKKEKWMGYYRSKKASMVNKIFLDLVEKYNLTITYPIDVAYAINSKYRHAMTLHPFEDDKFVVEMNEDDYLESLDSLERMSEADFYQMKSDAARKHGL